DQGSGVSNQEAGDRNQWTGNRNNYQFIIFNEEAAVMARTTHPARYASTPLKRGLQPPLSPFTKGEFFLRVLRGLNNRS
ncbi:MAG: hypothetical protein V3U15_01585, partial [Nitrospinota bacterium]